MRHRWSGFEAGTRTPCRLLATLQVHATHRWDSSDDVVQASNLPAIDVWCLARRALEGMSQVLPEIVVYCTVRKTHCQPQASALQAIAQLPCEARVVAAQQFVQGVLLHGREALCCDANLPVENVAMLPNAPSQVDNRPLRDGRWR